MGNHFRTSGDERPARSAQVPGTVPAPSTPGSPQHPSAQADLFSQVPAAPASGHAAPAAGRIPNPAAPSQTSAGLFMGNPSTPAPSAAPAQTAGFDASTFRTRDGAVTPSTDVNEQRQVADLDAALASPDFTTVFAPLRDEAASKPSRREQAQKAGVEPVILLEHLTKIYPAQPNKPALDDVNIAIYPGEFVFLVGHSGSGKTTLLNTMLRNVKPTSGRVLVAGQDLMRIKNRRIPFLRRQIGAVFQDYKLLPNRTAYENVAFALQCIGKPRGVIRAQVPEVLRLVGLADQMHSLPDQLSGGEQQRVSVARAMVNRPPLLICDEPTGNLDPAISLGIMKLLDRINHAGTTVIVATHDREMVDSMHRRVIALEGGRVIRDQERGGYGNYDAF